MSADSLHHQVEMSLKQCGKVYDFTDNEQCEKNSCGGKVDMRSLSTSDFRDWPDASSTYKIRRMGYGGFNVICPRASSQCVTPLQD